MFKISQSSGNGKKKFVIKVYYLIDIFVFIQQAILGDHYNAVSQYLLNVYHTILLDHGPYHKIFKKKLNV